MSVDVHATKGSTTETNLAIMDVAWLADGILLVLAAGNDLFDNDTRLALVGSGVGASLPARWTRWPESRDGSFTYLFACQTPPSVVDSDTPAGLCDDGGSTLLHIESDYILSDLQTLLRDHLARLPPDLRHAILEFLGATIAEFGGASGRSQLSAGMFRVREALRERRQCSVMSPNRPLVVNVDRLLRLTERSFFVSGWLRDTDAAPARLTAVAPEGYTTELLRRAWFHARPDLSALFPQGPRSSPAGGVGFVCQFELPFASRLFDGWLVEMASESGQKIESAAPPVTEDALQALEGVLEHLAYERLPDDELRTSHIQPAISALLPRTRQGATIGRAATYGRPRTDPVVSVIVPLYGRIDLIEHQLAQFAADPEWAAAELIFVLDSPEFDAALAELSPHLYELYSVPFRTFSLERNGGFANANNMGAAQASGDLLLLMNSDVLPDRPNWLSAMIEFYERTPAIGALGPKLLFEDDTLQHAGMYFARLPASGVWDNRHYFKGLDRRLPPANVARPVPAVTGACMMIETALYRDMGGLSGEYIQGDYEDSDLCIRLARSGRTNWYLPNVELYHLEGQSYESAIRERNGNYNRWLHTHLWRADIEAIMERASATPTALSPTLR